jgi:ankyrin repeat protein
MYPNTKIKNQDLILLVSLGSETAVKQKLLGGWDPNVLSNNGVTSAIIAAECNNLEMLQILIDAGADVSIADPMGWTPLKCALENKNQTMIDLIEKTILTKIKKNKVKRPELVTLVSLGDDIAVKQKLLEGWDPNVRNNNGTTPALRAAARNDLVILQMLIDAGADVTVELVGWTPLRLAQENKNQAMIDLIEKTIRDKI